MARQIVYMKKFELLKVVIAPALVSSVATVPTDELGYLTGILTLAFMLGGYLSSMHW